MAFDFLKDGDEDDGAIRINTRQARRPAARNPGKTMAQQADDLAKGLDGCGKQMLGCGCLLILLGLLLGLPFLIAL